MSISRWAAGHWGDLTWFPLWFTGMPFHQVYQPAFQLTVAAASTLFHVSIEHAYHFLVALEYSAGPVTLFLLYYFTTRSRGGAFVAGLLYSLVSPMCLLVPAIRYDTGGLLTARRFIILLRYGEGPHTTAVMMVPLVLLALHYAAAERRRWALLVAPFALAALVLTNWPGTVGLTLAIAAYVLSRFGSSKPIHWLTFIGVAVVAYMIACPWIPPSILRTVQRNAQQSAAMALGRTQALSFLGLGLALLALHFVCERWKANPWLRFFLYDSVITGVISVGREWFGWQLLPQANRFGVEFELAFSGLLAFAGTMVYERSPRQVRIALITALAVVCIWQGARFRKFAHRESSPIDITGRIEYRMAKWFDAHMHEARVFAPGNVSLWMNMFTDTPQVAGCCDQGIPSQEYRIAIYTIYSGQNAGSHDAEISLLWLKAYGADAIGVSGPKSEESFRPYWNPRKFEGILPVLWRDGDNAVYDVERRSRSLAHVVTRAQLVSRPPENGLDIDPLVTYVSAVEAPDAPVATFRWINLHQARIEAALRPGDLVSVQVTHDPGWRATVAGSARKTFADALGLMVIEPECAGKCTIDLVWDGGSEAKWMRVVQILGMLLCVLGVVSRKMWRYESNSGLF